MGEDVTCRPDSRCKQAAALHRAEVLERLLWQVRQEVLAPRMMQAVLESLVTALNAAGALILDLLAPPDAARVQHSFGQDPGAALAGMFDHLQTETLEPATSQIMGLSVLACPSYTRHGDRAGLCVWRAAGSAPWTQSDAKLVSSITAVARMVLEHEAIQRELARQARTDPLTGLLNRRSFLEDVSRRIDRLDREGLPGTLMYVDLDHLKQLNDRCGHEVGDKALLQTATLLRQTVRAVDIVARLGGDEFALWLDGSDELTAAERAERLRMDGPTAFAAALMDGAPAISLSIGIAARHPHAAEALDEVMRRADLAMYQAKRAGGAQWRVSHDAFA